MTVTNPQMNAAPPPPGRNAESYGHDPRPSANKVRP